MNDDFFLRRFLRAEAVQTGFGRQGSVQQRAIVAVIQRQTDMPDPDFARIVIDLHDTVTAFFGIGLLNALFQRPNEASKVRAGQRKLVIVPVDVYNLTIFVEHVAAGIDRCEYIHRVDCGFHHELQLCLP